MSTPRADAEEAEAFIGVSTMDSSDVQKAYDFARQLERELEEANRDARLLREQCRVGDVAFQHLHATSHGQQVPDWVNDGLPNLYTLLSQLTTAKSALEKAKQTLDSAQRSMPAYHEGGFYFERHDMDGNYIGAENVDPISVVQGLDQAVTEALTAINAALEDSK